MTHFDVLLLAFALSIDAFLVSFSKGICLKKNRLKYSILLAFSVSFFQFLMPIVGAYLTTSVKSYIDEYSKFIVFAIFLTLGIKFILDAKKQTIKQEKCNISYRFIILAGIATSLDALAAGVPIGLSSYNIIVASLIIGVITLINSLIAFWSGNILSKKATANLEFVAAIIIIFLGIKELF